MRALQEQLLPSPTRDSASSGVLFRWVRPVIERGKLTLDDLWTMPESCDVRRADAALQRELQAHPGAPLAAVLFACFWRQMLPASLCKLAADLLRYLPPLLVSALLEILDSPEQDMPIWPSVIWAYSLAVLLPICTLTQAVLVNQYFWYALRLGALARAALAAAISRRALRYRLCDPADSGLLTNLLSSDCGRISTACGSLNMLWSAPLQLAIALGMLWRALGPAVLGGLAIMLLLMPVQAWISQALAGLRARTATATDGRLRQTGSMLEARQAVKLQRWEALCAAEVAQARRAEADALRREAAVKAVSVLLVTVAPTTVSLATFTVLALSGQPLRAAPVFSALVLFNAMRSPLSALPDLFTSLAHSRVALSRIQKVLSSSGGPHSSSAPPWPCPSPSQPPPWQPAQQPPRSRRSSRAEGDERSSDGDSDSSEEDEEADGRGGGLRDPLVMLYHASFSWRGAGGGGRGGEGSSSPSCASRGGASPAARCPSSRRSPSAARRVSITNGVWAAQPACKPEMSPSASCSPAAFTGVDSYSGAAAVSAEEDTQATASRAPARPTANGSPEASTVASPIENNAHGSLAALRDVSFCVQRGQLLAVVGGMGSGKSTLMAALLGELAHVGGEVYCAPNVGYSGQNVHIVRGTVRENILYGRPFDLYRYQATLEACALRADIASWPDGEYTELGERGGAISGGQQARVALARAVYGRPDVCFLDEPLASLDPQTCTHVWSAALRGLLRRSAVVVSTSSAQLAMAADLVLLLDSGGVVEYGTPAALAAAAGPFSELLADSEASASPSPTASSLAPWSGAGFQPLPSGCLRSSVPGPFGSGNLSPVELSSPECRSHLLPTGSSPTLLKLDEPSPAVAAALPEVAARRVDRAWRSAEGRGFRAKTDSYYAYAAQFGGRGSVFAVSTGMFAVAQGSIVLADCWLARWSSLAPGLQDDLVANLGGLALLTLLAAVLVALQATAWPLLCLRASSAMHAKGLDRALRSPFNCALATAHGQMMSRFSKDMDTVDSRLPSMLSQAFTCIAALSCSLVTIMASSPRTAPATALLGFCFLRLTGAYRPIASEATRLVSVLHGPVVAHLLESLGGREYVRAFAQEGRVVEQMLALLEASARSQVFNLALQRWLALQLEVLGAVMLLCVALLCVASRQEAALGFSGLSLTYSLTLTALAKYLVNYGTRADAQFASVERLHAVMRLQPEEVEQDQVGCQDKEEPQPRSVQPDTSATLDRVEAGAAEPPADWPARGLLVLNRYRPAAYTANGRHTLHPLTLTVRPGEHVAVIGRSGAGKSTFLAGLSRLLPVGRGSMTLDGVSATSVSLSRWRAAIHCIPQQPLVLAGSVAHNLDPEGKLPATALWEALRLAGVDAWARELPRQLDTQLCGAEGEQVQLSSCQRKLLVFARLLLHRRAARLVLLDEPTAGMEQQEGLRLHSLLHEHLVHAAAIAVTHHVLPVLHLFSRVLVFADGHCAEDGSPAELLQGGGRLHELLIRSPVRVQAHVQRMMALQRSQGLPAVRHLLRSVSKAPPDAQPDRPDGAVRP